MLHEKPVKGMDNIFKNARSIIAIFFVVFCCVFLTLLVFVPIPEANTRVVNIAIGLVLGSLTAIMSYYFGSSKGKDDQDKVNQQVAVETVANQTQAQAVAQQAVVSPGASPLPGATPDAAGTITATGPSATMTATLSPGTSVTSPTPATTPVKKTRSLKQRVQHAETSVVVFSGTKEQCLDEIESRKLDGNKYVAKENTLKGTWEVLQRL